LKQDEGMVKAVDAWPVRVSAAKNLEKCCVIERHSLRDGVAVSFKTYSSSKEEQFNHGTEVKKESRSGG
jgi:hypothetical protein